MTSPHLDRRSFLGVAAALVVGCNAQPQTHPVTGTVSYKGKPVVTGTVAFHPVDPKAPLAKGEIRPDGTYELSTFRANDGAAIGDYAVTVHAYDPPRGTEGDPDYKPPKLLVPERFSAPAKTPLKVSVRPGKNDVPLSLDP